VNPRRGVEKLPQPVKSYEVWYGVISLAVACLPAKRQASYRGQELYSGSFTELGNLHGNDKGRTQWDHPRGHKPKYCSGTDCPVVVMKLL